jgi:pimeloyl-ACP methyl ester carboxylesterase
LPLAKLQQLDGSEQAPRLGLQRYRQAVFEMQQGAKVALDWPAARELQRATLQARLSRGDWNQVSLSVLHGHYEGEDSRGIRRASEVFAFSPLQQEAYHGANLELLLEPEAVLSYAATPITGYWLDAGDGLGFRSLQPGQPFIASYSTAGTKTLTLRALQADGDTLQASSSLEVVQLATPDPDETWNIVASETYEGLAGSGTAYVYLAEGHATVTNPVVIVEGFDIDNSLDWPALYDLLNRENLLEDLRADGFDAVVLDFTDAVDHIQRNGLVLVELLEMVNAATAPGQTSAIVGASMGGLVSRYALLWMEDQAIPHRVRKLISFDSPHKGANIPLGMQAWVEFFAGQAEEADFLLQQLRSPAARQMLLYHLDGVSGSTANPDPALAMLNNDFVALGNWPAQPQLVSIVNGSGSMQGQGFAPGDQLIEWNYDIGLAAVDGDVWAVPDGGSKQIFDGRIFIFLSTNVSDSLTVSGTLPWDNAPGGSRPTMQQAADVEAPVGDIIALHDSHSFIPTVSALALDTNDPFYDIAGDAQILDHTPFQTVYFPTENQGHIDITPENKLWFMAEIPAPVVEVIFANGFE